MEANITIQVIQLYINTNSHGAKKMCPTLDLNIMLGSGCGSVLLLGLLVLDVDQVVHRRGGGGILLKLVPEVLEIHNTVNDVLVFFDVLVKFLVLPL